MLLLDLDKKWKLAKLCLILVILVFPFQEDLKVLFWNNSTQEAINVPLLLKKIFPFSLCSAVKLEILMNFLNCPYLSMELKCMRLRRNFIFKNAQRKTEKVKFISVIFILNQSPTMELRWFSLVMASSIDSTLISILNRTKWVLQRILKILQWMIS